MSPPNSRVPPPLIANRSVPQVILLNFVPDDLPNTNFADAFSRHFGPHTHRYIPLDLLPGRVFVDGAVKYYQFNRAYCDFDVHGVPLYNTHKLLAGVPVGMLERLHHVQGTAEEWDTFYSHNKYFQYCSCGLKTFPNEPYKPLNLEFIDNFKYVPGHKFWNRPINSISYENFESEIIAAIYGLDYYVWCGTNDTGKYYVSDWKVLYSYRELDLNDSDIQIISSNGTVAITRSVAEARGYESHFDFVCRFYEQLTKLKQEFCCTHPNYEKFLYWFEPKFNSGMLASILLNYKPEYEGFEGRDFFCDFQRIKDYDMYEGIEQLFNEERYAVAN